MSRLVSYTRVGICNRCSRNPIDLICEDCLARGCEECLDRHACRPAPEEPTSEEARKRLQEAFPLAALSDAGDDPSDEI